MPEEMSFRPDEQLMNTDEALTLISLFVESGFDKIRFTGGEPTLRDDLPTIVKETAAMGGANVLAMTTNGLRLASLAKPLRDRGLQRVNVSLDTLDPTRFRRVTRWGSVREVLDGIAAAHDAGLDVKVNSVVIRDFNDETDAVELARLSVDHPWQIRFIEMMPFAGLFDFQKNFAVSSQTLRERIEAALGPMSVCHEGRLDGEAQLYSLPRAKGTVGFIMPLTQPFCAACNRVRLTADGVLRLCLHKDQEVDLLTPLRGGMPRDQLLETVQEAVWQKPWGHDLNNNRHTNDRTMSEIGG
jgi:cyclic pyranopterin phosphate synthase